MRRRAAAAIAAALLVALGACGDDDDDDAGSPSAPSESTAAAPTSPDEGGPTTSSGGAAPTSGDGPASGEPIKAGVAASSTEGTYDSVVGGAQAAVKALNERGGINGRPVELVECDFKSDPNTAAACGRTLVDEGVVAMLGVTGSVTESAAQVWEAEGIPTLGDTAAGSRAMSPLVFPVSSGGTGLFAGQGYLAGQAGATRVSLVRADLDITEGLDQLFQAGLDQFGASFVNDVKVPVNAPDMAPYVAAAEANGAEAVILATLQADEIKFIRAAKQSGSDLIIVANGNTIDAGLAEGFGADMDGVYSVGWFKPSTLADDEAVQRFNDELDANGYDGQRGMLVVNAWASVQLLEEVAGRLDAVDAQSINAAMPSVTDFNSGMAPTISFAQPLDIFQGQHFFTPFVFLSQVTGGELQPVEETFIDPFGTGAVPS